MSLINDVLRDLEARRQNGAEDALRGARPVVRQRLRRLPLVLALGALAGAAGAAYWWQQRDAAPPELAAVSAVQVAAPPAAPVAQPVPVPQPPVRTRLAGFGVSQTDASAELILSFSGEFEHVARLEEGGRRVSVDIPGVDPGAAVPSLRAGLVGAIDLSRHEGGLRLNLELARAARMQSGLSAGNELRLRLEAEAEPQPEPVPAAVEAAPAVASVAAPKAEAVAVAPPAPAEQTPGPAAAEPPSFHKAPTVRTPSERAAARYREALDALQARRPSEAEQALTAALELDPGHREARMTLVELYIARARPEAAEQLLRQALATDAGHPAWAVRYGRLLSELGREEEAAVLLTEHLPAQVGDGEHYALLAALYQRQARYAESAELYGRVLGVHPRRAVWWVGLAISLEGAARPDEARSAYERALRLGELSPATRAYAAQRYAALGS